jgi:hypothetical protein
MTDLRRLNPNQAPRLLSESGHHRDDDWSGYLTVENVHHVAARITEQFGGRRFSVCSVFESSDWRPHLWTGCVVGAYNPVSARVTDDGVAVVSFSAADTGFTFMSALETQPPKGFRFTAERGKVWMEFDRLRMTTFEMAPNGQQFRWSFMLEPEYRRVHDLVQLALASKAIDPPSIEAALQELRGDW